MEAAALATTSTVEAAVVAAVAQAVHVTARARHQATAQYVFSLVSIDTNFMLLELVGLMECNRSDDSMKDVRRSY